MSTSSTATHTEFNASEVSAYYAARVPGLVQRGAEWRGPCPVHGGKDDNFTVNAESGCWCCHSQCGRGGSMFDLEMTLSNTEFRVAADEVRRIAGRCSTPVADRMNLPTWGLPRWSIAYLRERIEKVEQSNRWQYTAVYPYFKLDGDLGYVKVRFRDKQNGKTFRQYALTPNFGWAARNKAGVAPLLYRAHKLAAASEVFIVNGEKAADRGAAELGIVTTCAPDGEGSIEIDLKHKRPID